MLKVLKLFQPPKSLFIGQPIWKDSITVLPQVQCVRERKRTCLPPRWFRPKKTKSNFFNREELSPENRAFVQELIHDRYPPCESPLKDEPWPRNEWTITTRRAGILGIKIGSFPQWKKDGTKFYTTLIQVLDNHVVNYVPPDLFKQSMGWKPYWKNYGSLVVGALSDDPQRYTKSYCNLFTKAGIPPKRKLTRFLITPNAAIQPGTPLKATHFKVGDYVDVQAKTIGHGFQGVVKRWGFKGGPATHGATKFHRRPGSIGAGRRKSGVWKGKKMPGHMGMDWRHLKGLRIWRINTEYNVLYLTGPYTPGPNHCYTRVFDTRLHNRRQEMSEHPPHMPTFYPDQDAAQPLPIDIIHQDVFRMDQPTIIYEEASESK